MKSKEQILTEKAEYFFDENSPFKFDKGEITKEDFYVCMDAYAEAFVHWVSSSRCPYFFIDENKWEHFMTREIVDSAQLRKVFEEMMQRDKEFSVQQ